MSKLYEIIEKPLSGEWGSDDETGKGILVLRTTNFTNVGVIDYSNVVTRIIDTKKAKLKFLTNGDIIIEKSGGSPAQPVGRVVLFEGKDNIYLFNNFTSLLRLKDKDINLSKYLFYHLFANYKMGGTRKFQNKTTGISNLKLDKFIKETEIMLPPLKNQKQIAKTLDTVSELLAMRKQQLAELDNLIKSTFYDMFGDPLTNEKGWEIKSLKDICTKITDGTHDTPKRVENGILFMTGKNIRPFLIDLSNIEYVSPEDHEIIYKRCNPQLGDILYTNIGVNYGTAAKCTLAFEFSMKNVALLKIDREVTESIYLECILNYERDYIINQNQTGGAQTFMGLATIKNIKIIVPPTSLQIRFSSIVTKIEEQKALVKKAIDETQYLFDSLMGEYFE